MSSVSHAEVARVLHDVAAELPAAEAHGCLCGALCADDDYALAQWLVELAPEPGHEGQLEQPESAIPILFRATAESLKGDGMNFVPLLPDDDAPLALRTEALAEWVQGFLYGLAAGEIGRRPDLPAAVNEVLRDFAEISRATLDQEGEAPEAEADAEADEEAFAEVHEFVRVGVQLVYDELLPLRRA